MSPVWSPTLARVPSSPLLDFTGAAGDGARIEAALLAAVRTSDPYLDELAAHLIVAGGKRLRPVLTVVAAQVGGGLATDAAIQGGIACELVQTGSLYHDDVIDESYSRRGVETVNAKWGNLQAILAGDFLLSRASEIAASLGAEVAGLLAHTIGRLCEGEIEQLRHTYNSARPEATYLSSIGGKTAALFSTAAAHRWPRRRAAAGAGRCAHRVRPGVRDGLPDPRRHPRHHLDRGVAGQAGRPRPRRGRVHPARAADAAGRRCRRSGADRAARQAARTRRAGQGPGDRPRQPRRRLRPGDRHRVGRPSRRPPRPPAGHPGNGGSRMPAPTPSSKTSDPVA